MVGFLAIAVWQVQKMALRKTIALVLALLAAACSTGISERQWYKPSGDYTAQDLRRDMNACTREKKLDLECLRAKGWVDLSQDAPKPAPEPEPARKRY